MKAQRWTSPDGKGQPSCQVRRDFASPEFASSVAAGSTPYNGIENLFVLRRRQVPAAQYRAAQAQAFQAWCELTGVVAAAKL